MQATQVQQTGKKGATHRQHSCSTQATQVQHTGNPGGAVNTGAGNTVVTIRQKRCNKHATQVQHMDNTGATTDRPSTCALVQGAYNLQRCKKHRCKIQTRQKKATQLQLTRAGNLFKSNERL